jgi:hypothetical protein
MDSFAAAFRALEARHLSRTCDLYADVVEPRISAWDVCAGELAIVARGRVSTANFDIARHGVGSARRLGRDRLVLRRRALTKFSRIHPMGLGHLIELTRPLRRRISRRQTEVINPRYSLTLILGSYRAEPLKSRAQYCFVCAPIVTA